MANILIAGDSWGIGVFAGEGDNYGPTGQGIQSILESQGHAITNISKGGGANNLIVDRLTGDWYDTGRCLFGVDPQDRKDFDLTAIDHIVFLQTDIFRERHYYGSQIPGTDDNKWKILEQTFVDSLQSFDSLADMITDYFEHLYSRLNSINKKILMIGGWSQLHPSITSYPNLIPVIYSSTKLLIPELDRDVYLSDPEWFGQLAKDQRFMSKFGEEFKPMAIDAETKLALIYKHWREVHPDLQGYQRLTDVLVKYF